MATNDFKPFAVGAGANVMSQADWIALTALATGFQAGMASSAQVNKALRQSSVIASMIAQFTADSTGQDVLDNGNLPTLQAAFGNAVSGRLAKVLTFTSSGTYTPTTGTKKIRVRAVGGGGGGGGVPSSSSATQTITLGGESGTYAEIILTLSSSSSMSVVIGAGGTGGAAGSNAGNAGGTTSLGSVLSCPGGNGASAGATSTNSAVTTPASSLKVPTTTGTLINSLPSNRPGGGVGIVSQAASGGAGGSNPLGVGGAGGTSANGNRSEAVSGSGYGSGGGGAAAVLGGTLMAGGNGSSGIIIIEEYV